MTNHLKSPQTQDGEVQNTVLSDEQIDKILWEHKHEFEPSGAHHIPALCRTVKALRAEIVTSDQEWQSRLAEVERERDRFAALADKRHDQLWEAPPYLEQQK